jgi:hypothetical protein
MDTRLGLGPLPNTNASLSVTLRALTVRNIPFLEVSRIRPSASLERLHGVLEFILRHTRVRRTWRPALYGIIRISLSLLSCRVKLLCVSMQSAKPA